MADEPMAWLTAALHVVQATTALAWHRRAVTAGKVERVLRRQARGESGHIRWVVLANRVTAMRDTLLARRSSYPIGVTLSARRQFDERQTWAH